MLENESGQNRDKLLFEILLSDGRIMDLSVQLIPKMIKVKKYFQICIKNNMTEYDFKACKKNVRQNNKVLYFFT